MNDLKPGYEKYINIHCCCERVGAQVVLVQLKMNFSKIRL